MKDPGTPRPERLQKLIAAAGLGSRRAVEDWIRAGRVTVNGRQAKLGDQATASDEVCLDGTPLALAATGTIPRRVIIYNKPIGEVTTRSDPQRRRTVFHNLPKLDAGRWVAIGRLDVLTSGLLLFTTDGELAHRLMHPSSEVEREYLVRVRGRLTPYVVDRLRKGVELEDGRASFDSITIEERSPEGTLMRVVLREGRNREVRRLLAAVSHEVIGLTRVRYGPVELPPDLPPGSWREVPQEVVDRLTE
jgi:23S rRNA pseudouridine2605 synthase